MANNKVICCAGIKDQLCLNVTPRKIGNYLANDNLIQTKMQGKPSLTKVHKQKRLDMAIDKIRWTHEWGLVILSDEKKFNLDSPDWHHCYCHNSEMEKNYIFKKSSGMRERNDLDSILL